MAGNLQSITQKVIRLVEEKTGTPVIVHPDPSLGTLTSLKVARRSAAAHIITYNLKAGAGTDYAICSQCALLLRAFQIPPAERFDFGASSKGRGEAEDLVDQHLRRNGISFPKEVRNQLIEGMFLGLMVHLRSVPVGLRADAWLATEFPELLDQQRAVVSRQMHESLRVLEADVRRMTPEKMYRATVAINAALAAYWAKIWNDPVPLAPYRETGHLAAGESLLKLWYDVPADPAHDRQLIDAWGQALGLVGWYEFMPVGEME